MQNHATNQQVNGHDPSRDPDMIWATSEEYAEIRRKRRSRAGVPARFQDADLGNWETDLPGQRKVLDIARYYLEKFPELRRRGSGMVFFGPAGTGKTRMSCTLVNELADRGVDAFYTKFPTVLNRLRRTYNNRAFEATDRVETRESVVEDLVSYDLLALDELASVSGSADEVGLVYDVIDGRYEQARPTIVATNLNRTALVQFLTDRLVDRLADQRGAFVAFDWDSRRG